MGLAATVVIRIYPGTSPGIKQSVYRADFLAVVRAPEKCHPHEIVSDCKGVVKAVQTLQTGPYCCPCPFGPGCYLDHVGPQLWERPEIEPRVRLQAEPPAHFQQGPHHRVVRHATFCNVLIAGDRQARR
eukprot:84330-Amphidinium_carterae.1